jgi:bleomycin hydrolase
MRARFPVIVLWAGLLLGPAESSAAAAVRSRAGAPVSPITGLALSPLTAVPALSAGLTSLAAPSLSGSLSPTPAAPAVAASLSAAPLPVLPAPAMPALRGSAALPAAAADAATISAEPGRFADSAGRMRSSISATLRRLFHADAALAARAGEGEGVDPDWVEEMARKDKKVSETTKRRRGRVRRDGFTDAALNRELLARHNGSYTLKLPVGPVSDQRMSGECWIYGGLNMIRSLLLSEARIPKKFQFSANYLHFFNMLEKSNRSFEKAMALAAARARGEKVTDRKVRETAGRALEENITDGGYFQYFQFLVDKYGLAPQAAMPETRSSRNTDTLNRELSLALAAGVEELMARTQGLSPKAAAKAAGAAKMATLERVWKVLATHLGTPPASFKHRSPGRRAGREYTPKSFARDFAGFRPEDYVVVTSMPNKDLGSAYKVRRSAIGAARPGQRRYDLRFLNLGTDRLEELVVASLKAGRPVYFDSDSHQDMDQGTGIMHPDIYKRAGTYGLTKAQAQAKASRQAASLLQVRGSDHIMLITGLDRPAPDEPVVKFRVENSWGRGAGDRGVFHMYREWLRENVYGVVIHKSLLTPAERKLWRSKAQDIREDGLY